MVINKEKVMDFFAAAYDNYNYYEKDIELYMEYTDCLAYY